MIHDIWVLKYTKEHALGKLEMLKNKGEITQLKAIKPLIMSTYDD